MLQANPYLSVMTALNFTMLDLAANRRGVLSTDQRKRLQRRRFHDVKAWSLSLSLAVLIGWLSNMRVLLVGALAAALVISAVIWLRIHADLHGRVQHIQGRLTSVPNGLGGAAIVVGQERFPVSRRVQAAFQAQRRYRLYYTPFTRMILSAELV
jgi:hypothetical protein